MTWGHMRQTAVGSISGVAVECECGLTWRSTSLGQAQEEMVLHALHPERPDPTNTRITLPPREVPRTPNAWVDAHVGTPTKDLSSGLISLHSSGETRRREKNP